MKPPAASGRPSAERVPSCRLHGASWSVSGACCGLSSQLGQQIRGPGGRDRPGPGSSVPVFLLWCWVLTHRPVGWQGLPGSWMHPERFSGGNEDGLQKVHGGSDGKESACNVGDLGLIPGSGRSPREGHGNPLRYSCLENPHGQRSLVGYSPWGREESDMTKRLSTGQHSRQ